ATCSTVRKRYAPDLGEGRRPLARQHRRADPELSHAPRAVAAPPRHAPDDSRAIGGYGRARGGAAAVRGRLGAVGAGHARRRALLAPESRKRRRYEALACARARLTIAVSDADRRLLAAVAPSARVSAVPTGVDVDYFAPDGVAEVPGRLVFTGSMDWYPNEDGIVHFIEAVLPRVRREVPGATLTVVGRNPSPRLRAVAEAAGAQITGLVDDVRPHMAAV